MRPDPRLTALEPNGRALVFSTDAARTAEAIRPFSASDAAKYSEFSQVLRRLGAFLAPLLEMTPPSIDEPAAGELWDLLNVGRRFRNLGKADGFRLLRWMPTSAADLVSEWFASDVLQSAIASRAIAGTFSGPWSAGTGAVLLLNAAADPEPAGSTVIVTGGPGALTNAMAAAAREAGAEIRVGASVAQVLVKDGRAAGVLLADGTAVPARAVVSNADPKRTFLGLVDPVELEPGFLARMRNYRAPGTIAKVNLALGTLPSFRGVANPADLHGRIQIGPSIEYLERAFDAAKYGQISADPYLEITIPTLNDATLAPPGRHILSVYVQFAPFKLSGGTDWDVMRHTLGDIVLRTLEHYAPGIGATVEHRQVITPADLENVYGLTGGHPLHGEPSLDQLFTMRPVLGWAQYRAPIDGLFLCGAGTHPGGGLSGGPGQNAARAIVKALKVKTR
jgi:phytoene dehydrogenase-like protein